MTQPGFKRRVIGAGIWSLAGHLGVQGIKLGSNLIMTRLLVPEMFGLMAIVTVVMVGLTLLSDIGIRASIIQHRREDDAEFLNTAWTIQILRGIAIWSIAALLAWLLAIVTRQGWIAPASVYADPRLPSLIVVVSLTAIVSGLESTRIATATRGLLQSRISLIEIAAQLCAVLVMFIWAWIEPTIWALAAGWIASNIAKTVLSHTVLPGQRNRLTWNPRIARELLHFGKWILLTSVTGFLLSSGDRLILGAGIDAQRMGWYAIAFLLINVLNQLGGKLIGSVVYPALSAVWRERPVRLTNTYYRFRLPLDGVFLGASGFLCVAGASVVDLLYDARYAPAGEMLRILAIALIAKRYTLTENCFLAMDRPKLMALMISTRLLSLCLLVPAALHLLGMWGAIWGIALYEFVALPLTFHLKRRHGLWNLRRELLPLPAWPLGAALGWLFVNLSGVLTRA